MNVELTVERIKALSKTKGFKMKFICGNIGVRDNYFTDCKAKKIDIPVDKLTAVATMLDTTVEYLKGETDDPNFHLSSIGLKTFPYEKSGKRPVYGHASAGLGVIAHHWTHIRTLHCVGDGFRPNQKTLFVIKSVFFV